MSLLSYIQAKIGVVSKPVSTLSVAHLETLTQPPNFFPVHCRTLHPIYRQVALKYKDNSDLVFARLDLSTFKPFDMKVNQHRISIFKAKTKNLKSHPSSYFSQIIGYPSIKIFRRGNEELDYWGDNNVEDITDYIESAVLRKPNEL